MTAAAGHQRRKISRKRQAKGDMARWARHGAPKAHTRRGGSMAAIMPVFCKNMAWRKGAAYSLGMGASSCSGGRPNVYEQAHL